MAWCLFMVGLLGRFISAQRRLVVSWRASGFVTPVEAVRQLLRDVRPLVTFLRQSVQVPKWLGLFVWVFLIGSFWLAGLECYFIAVS